MPWLRSQSLLLGELGIKHRFMCSQASAGDIESRKQCPGKSLALAVTFLSYPKQATHPDHFPEPHYSVRSTPTVKGFVLKEVSEALFCESHVQGRTEI